MSLPSSSSGSNDKQQVDDDDEDDEDEVSCDKSYILSCDNVCITNTNMIQEGIGTIFPIAC